MRRCNEFLLATAFCSIISCGEGSAARPARQGGGDVDISPGATTERLQSDPLVQRADSLVRAGRHWRATALLAPRLSAPATALPELRLAGARAAAGWEGWSEVERLLRGAPWLDRQYGGEGRELLVRSALERGTDALLDAQLALSDAGDDANRVTRRVLLARAYDRANQGDSAHVHYLAAAARLPRVSDWLSLRAAGVMADSAERAALFARVRSAPARARILATDAQARERSGDFAGAARVFRRTGAEGSAFRVDALAARDAPARATLAKRIVAFLGGKPDNAEARQSIDILDKLGALAPRDELVVARAAASAAPAARAVAGFARAAAAAPLGAADRMTYAGALSRAGRAADAARVYATITDDASLAPLAAYQRARMLVQSGEGAAAQGALRQVAARFPEARAASAPALLLLADLQVDDGDLAGAAQSLKELVSRHPTAPQAPLARFRAGLMDLVASPTMAAQAFDSLAALHPSHEEAIAARYWAGRAYEKAGRQADAEARWRSVVRLEPLSYYAMLAAAQALLAAGEPARALRVALAAIARGDSSRALYRVAYPVLHDDALVEESRRHGLDPALVAGLIRQESSWNPRAVSPAAARGLMQLLPSVGASIAATRRYPLWNPALLFDPDVSLELGTAHLSASLRRGTAPVRALAAYNAGASRLARWLRRPGADDAELFAEWIPFTETRDYVRIVQRNAAVYRALYELK